MKDKHETELNNRMEWNWDHFHLFRHFPLSYILLHCLNMKKMRFVIVIISKFYNILSRCFLQRLRQRQFLGAIFLVFI